MKNIQPINIVFVTEGFVTNGCWAEWRIYFENKTYKTIPESKTVAWGGLTNAAKVDYDK